MAACETNLRRTENVKNDGLTTYVTHLYLMTDSPDLSDALYELVNDLMNFGWEICGPERGACFVHLSAVSMEKTRLKQLLRRNPWLRAFAFRQRLDPSPAQNWTAHLEFGAYGGYATKSLLILGRPDSNEYDSGLGTQPEYDPRWKARPRVAARRAARNENSGGVVTVSARGQVAIRSRLTFHGLPDEVERCLAVATVMLAERYVAAECSASGNDKYQVVVMSFETQKDTAFRVFNRLVAQVPAATSVLEYEDPVTGKPLTLRAVDGKIEGGRSK
jgi:hypothetical protein